VAVGIDRYDEMPFGFSWVMDEAMQRTSHALASDGRVWLIDPVEAPEALERAAALGTPAAVLQLIDRHKRDGAAIAARLGVPHLEVSDQGLPDGPFEAVRVIDLPGWREAALWWPRTRTLVVAEALGTAPWFSPEPGDAGMHPVLRLRPPRALRHFAPEHLLFGHGPGLHGPEATAALRRAHERSRRDLPRIVARLPSLGRG
jgi:hypothetical protein